MPVVKFSNYGCPRHFFHTHSYTIFYRASAGSRTKLTTVAPLSQCNGRAYHQELQLLSTLEDQGKFLAVGHRAQCPNLFDEKQWMSLSLLLWSHQSSCESLLATSAQQHFSGHIRGSESSTCLATFRSYSLSTASTLPRSAPALLCAFGYSKAPSAVTVAPVPRTICGSGSVATS